MELSDAQLWAALDRFQEIHSRRDAAAVSECSALRRLLRQQPRLSSRLSAWAALTLGVITPSVSSAGERGASDAPLATPFYNPPAPPATPQRRALSALSGDPHSASDAAVGSLAPLAQHFPAERLAVLNAQLRAYRLLSRNCIPPSQVLRQAAPPGSAVAVSDFVRDLLGEAAEDVVTGELYAASSSGAGGAASNGADGAASSAQTRLCEMRSAANHVMPVMGARKLSREQEIAVRSAMEKRAAELRDLSASHISESARMSAVTELKALQHFFLQAETREQVLQNLRQSLVLQASFGGAGWLAPGVRLHSEQDARREPCASFVRQSEFVGAVLQHARSFRAFHDRRRHSLLSLARKTKKVYEKREERRVAEEDRLEQERLRLLKEGDEDGYLQLLKEKKTERLDTLLQQTARFLDRLGNMVQNEKDRVVVEEANPEAAEKKKVGRGRGRRKKKAEDALSVNREVQGETTDYATAREMYYRIAHSVTEEVVEQPKMLRYGKLREYQLRGLQWLVSLYNNNMNGILADEMGLGKTIQTISMIAYLIEKKNNHGPYLVIVPLSTISNWKDEFERWTPDVKVVIYKGNPTVRRRIQRELLKEGEFNVLVTTFDYIMRDKAALSRIRWNFLIIDEGHRLKNSKCKLALILSRYYHPKHRLLLTGTPLQNSLPELWALLNFLLPKIFNSVQSFEEWFNAPFENAADRPDLNEEEGLLIIQRLHQVLRPFLLRRLKREVETQLPDKIEKVIRCDMSAWQRVLYKQMQEQGHVSVEGGSSRGMQNTLMQLKKICNHPYLFQEHVGYDIDEKMIRASGKLTVLDNILPKFLESGHRVLLFNQMTNVMDILEEFLTLRGMKYLRLDGGTKTEDRRAAMELWNEPGSEYFVFILSTRAGGLGLNLQTADTVILYDSDWNPQADLQAQDRAHRIGQRKKVLVLRLITVNSVEERILATAERKLGMDQKIIGAGAFNQQSDAEERREIFQNILSQEKTDEDSVDVHSWKEINKRIARSREEYKQFDLMDKASRTRHDEDGKPQLLTWDELPEFLKAKPTEKELAEREARRNRSEVGSFLVSDLGRGKRKSAVDLKRSYLSKLSEADFEMLLERGASQDDMIEFVKQKIESGELSSAAAVVVEDEVGDDEFQLNANADDEEYKASAPQRRSSSASGTRRRRGRPRKSREPAANAPSGSAAPRKRAKKRSRRDIELAELGLRALERDDGAPGADAGAGDGGVVETIAERIARRKTRRRGSARVAQVLQQVNSEEEQQEESGGATGAEGDANNNNNNNKDESDYSEKEFEEDEEMEVAEEDEELEEDDEVMPRRRRRSSRLGRSQSSVRKRRTPARRAASKYKE